MKRLKFLALANSTVVWAQKEYSFLEAFLLARGISQPERSKALGIA